MRTTVLIVDCDLGFVFWLGKLLDRNGYFALPAKTAADAALLVMRLDLEPELLVVNTSLSGSAELIAALRRRFLRLTVIGVLEHGLVAPAALAITAAHEKPIAVNVATEADWLSIVEHAVERLAKPQSSSGR